jgi:hypothetical protein
MGVGFDEVMRSAFGQLLDIEGIDAIYTPVDGEASEVKILAGPIDTEFEQDNGNEIKLEHRRIEISLLTIPDPQLNDKFTIDETDWIVVNGPAVEYDSAILQCRKDTPVSKRSEFGKKKLPV